MPGTCTSKPALLKGLRPVLSTQQQVAATQKILSSACSSSCIYCDIWKLATLIASHVPLSARYDLITGTPSHSPTSSRPSSPVLSSTISEASSPYASIVSASKKIEAQFQTQRSQLSSILSICTVSGAEQTEGLRMAHSRCSAAVEDLLDQEEELEEALLKDLQEQQYAHEYHHPSPYGYYSFSYERRPSMIDVTH